MNCARTRPRGLSPKPGPRNTSQNRGLNLDRPNSQGLALALDKVSDKRQIVSTYRMSAIRAPESCDIVRTLNGTMENARTDVC